MTRRTVIGLLVAVALSQAGTGPAFGFVTLKEFGNEIQWSPSHNIRWYLRSSGSSDVSDEELEAALQAAFDSWQNIDCADITFQFGGWASSDRANNRS